VSTNLEPLSFYEKQLNQIRAARKFPAAIATRLAAGEEMWILDCGKAWCPGERMLVDADNEFLLWFTVDIVGDVFKVEGLGINEPTEYTALRNLAKRAATKKGGSLCRLQS